MLEAELESDFLRGPMVLALSHVKGPAATAAFADAFAAEPVVMGSIGHRANYQSIRRVLRPGFYELSLRLLAPADSDPSGHLATHINAPFREDHDQARQPPGAPHTGGADPSNPLHNIELKHGGSMWVRFEFDLRLHEATPANLQLSECMDDSTSNLAGGAGHAGGAGVQVLPSHLNRIAYAGSELGAGHFNTHFFARFLYPSVHRQYSDLSTRPAHDGAPRAAVQHTETTQFVVPTTSLFRVSLHSDTAISVKLFEFPCARSEVKPSTHAAGAASVTGKTHTYTSWVSAVHGWRSNPLKHPRHTSVLHCRPRELASAQEEHDVHLLRYLMPGTYELHITEEDPHTEEDGELERARSHCASYEMEFALRSLHHYQGLGGVSASCPHTRGPGADHLPPHPPHTITEYYSYDSTRLRESLYFQQRYGSPREAHIIFEVKTPFRMFSEVGYEFLTGDLTLELTRLSAAASGSAATGGVDSPHPPTQTAGAEAEETTSRGDGSVFAGRGHLNRHVLALDYVTPGLWMLTIREPPSAGSEAGWFCSRFTFRLEIDPLRKLHAAHSAVTTASSELVPIRLSTPLLAVLRPNPFLPYSLDSIAYLYHDVSHRSQSSALVCAPLIACCHAVAVP